MKLIYLNIIIPLFNIVLPFIIKLFFPEGQYDSLILLIDIFVLPLGLLIMNIWLVLWKKENSLTFSFIIMLVGLLIGIIIGYFVGAAMAGRILNPDGESIWITRKLSIYYIIFSASCIVMGLIIDRFFFKRKKLLS